MATEIRQPNSESSKTAETILSQLNLEQQQELREALLRQESPEKPLTTTPDTQAQTAPSDTAAPSKTVEEVLTEAGVNSNLFKDVDILSALHEAVVAKKGEDGSIDSGPAHDMAKKLGM